MDRAQLSRLAVPIAIGLVALALVLALLLPRIAVPGRASESVSAAIGTSDSLPGDAAYRAALDQLQAVRGRSAELADRAEDARSEAEQADADAAALAATIQLSEATMIAQQARIGALEREIGKREAALAARQVPLSRLIGGLETLSRRPPVAMAVAPGGLDAMILSRAALEGVVPSVASRTDGLRADLARLWGLRQQRDAALAQIESVRRTLAANREALGQLSRQRRALASELNRASAIEADNAAELAERARTIGVLVAGMESAARSRTALAALPGPVPRPGSTDERVPAARAQIQGARNASRAAPDYTLPVVGRVARGFGSRLSGEEPSTTLAIEAPGGAQVTAPAAGRVAYAAPYRSYGMVVIIDHGGGWTSVLTGLGSVSVAVGDRLGKSAPLGRAGEGRVTIELRRDGVPVNPVRLIR